MDRSSFAEDQRIASARLTTALQGSIQWRERNAEVTYNKFCHHARSAVHLGGSGVTQSRTVYSGGLSRPTLLPCISIVDCNSRNALHVIPIATARWPRRGHTTTTRSRKVIRKPVSHHRYNQSINKDWRSHGDKAKGYVFTLQGALVAETLRGNIGASWIADTVAPSTNRTLCLGPEDRHRERPVQHGQ